MDTLPNLFFKQSPVVHIWINPIRQKYKDCPHYKIEEQFVKVPGGFLIEQWGWKGKRYGDAGIHDKQALVIVNHGTASGKELFDLSKSVLESVKKEFNIILERELNII